MADISQFNIVAYQNGLGLWRASISCKDGGVFTIDGTTMENFVTSADTTDEESAIDLAVKAIRAMP